MAGKFGVRKSLLDMFAAIEAYKGEILDALDQEQQSVPPNRVELLLARIVDRANVSCDSKTMSAALEVQKLIREEAKSLFPALRQINVELRVRIAELEEALELARSKAAELTNRG